ncbi:unnamed protein product [Strongylus vulgaris]|uniref:Uncharacterized protein n=1 Tax=Strongylus vulgaris TaxID=40348 RepID=A0A3P7KGA2_STRVU|nr:unnamed protein product [Strongylus vulgaris]
MCRGVRVQDEWTYFCGIWVKNRSIVIILAVAQFIVATVSLAQHIFLCSFNESSPNAGNFLSADVIIFDFGLFHELIQVGASRICSKSMHQPTNQLTEVISHLKLGSPSGCYRHNNDFYTMAERLGNGNVCTAKPLKNEGSQ